MQGTDVHYHRRNEYYQQHVSVHPHRQHIVITAAHSEIQGVFTVAFPRSGWPQQWHLYTPGEHEEIPAPIHDRPQQTISLRCRDQRSLEFYLYPQGSDNRHSRMLILSHDLLPLLLPDLMRFGMRFDDTVPVMVDATTTCTLQQQLLGPR